MKIKVHTEKAEKQLEGMRLRSTINAAPIATFAAFEAVKDSKRAIKSTKSDPNTGDPWQPAKQPLVVRRRRRGKVVKKLNRGLLWDTGKLISSITPGTIRRGDRWIAQAGVVSLENARGGNTEEYGPVHQFGGGHVPARPFVGLTEAGIERVARFAAKYIAEGR